MVPSSAFTLESWDDDPTLGGIFEMYSVEEYQRIVEVVKEDRGEGDPDVIAMERDLARLKADREKGEFVIYKGAFPIETETVMVAFNPTIVMRPELVNRNTPLTAETYRNDMEEVPEILEDAAADGFLTEAQKKRVLDKDVYKRQPGIRPAHSGMGKSFRQRPESNPDLYCKSGINVLFFVKHL